MMERIKDAVIEVYKIDPATKSKVRPVSEARQAFCYFCRKYTKFTSRSIGEAVGITHGSVLYNAKAYGNLLMYEKIRVLAGEIEFVLGVNDEVKK